MNIIAHQIANWFWVFAAAWLLGTNAALVVAGLLALYTFTDVYSGWLRLLQWALLAVALKLALPFAEDPVFHFFQDPPLVPIQVEGAPVPVQGGFPWWAWVLVGIAGLVVCFLVVVFARAAYVLHVQRRVVPVNAHPEPAEAPRTEEPPPELELERYPICEPQKPSARERWVDAGWAVGFLAFAACGLWYSYRTVAPVFGW